MTPADFVGFAKLKPGRIHLYCPKCKRKMSNVPRADNDPDDAVLAQIFCPECASGGKDRGAEYLDATGKFL